MGFGSYDESEQEKREQNTEAESEEVVNKDGDYSGEVEFESSTSEAMLEQFQSDVKQDEENNTESEPSVTEDDK